MSTILYFFVIPTISIAFLLSFPIVLKIANHKYSYHFLSGVVIYIIIHNISKFNSLINKLYIISHELSHALAGILKGNKIKKIKISDTKGYVSFSKKPDKFTTIFPYIFPFYNILILLLYFLIFLVTEINLYVFFTFFEGFFLTFYIINTISIILTPQSDFRKFGGRLKSIFFITMLNICIVMITLVIIFPEKNFVYELITELIKNYRLVISWFFNFLLNLTKLIIEYAAKIF